MGNKIFKLDILHKNVALEQMLLIQKPCNRVKEAQWLDSDNKHLQS